MADHEILAKGATRSVSRVGRCIDGRRTDRPSRSREFRKG